MRLVSQQAQLKCQMNDRTCILSELRPSGLTHVAKTYAQPNSLPDPDHQLWLNVCCLVDHGDKRLWYTSDTMYHVTEYIAKCGPGPDVRAYESCYNLARCHV